ncbi:MAG TPA: TRAP transporter TatT component family protein, partial [Candidatus Goldiibacteriota bacterium]|nr:TRAP transporter TatT component family protein [Candidatus Goldiibacteriota bacterium]
MNKPWLTLVLCVLLLPVFSCSMKRITIDSTGLFMDDVSDAFFEESDVDFAEQAIPANLKLLEGLIKGSDYENEGLLLKGCKMFGMYAMGFMEDASADKKTDKKNLKRASAFYQKAKDYG